MVGIFRKFINHSVVIPQIVLNDDTCTLSVYESASTVYLVIEYLYHSEQQCAYYALGKDGLSGDRGCIMFSDRSMAKYLVASHLKDYRDEAEQSIELCIDRKILDVFFQEMFRDKSLTLETIVEIRSSPDFSMKSLEDAFKAIGSPIVFKEPTAPSCVIS